MRLFIAGILQETNYFSPIPTGGESFLNQYWDPKQQSSPPDHVNLLAYGGALERAQALQVETVPSIFASAVPAAPMGRATWQSLKARILDDLLEATPIDALFLFLHGAMAAKDVDDCEGELLEAARTIVGEAVPIASVLDLHGNLSDRMMRSADYVIACKEYPHVDLREQAARAVDLLQAQVEGKIHPTSFALRVPLLTISPTTSGPVKPFVEAMRSAEDAQSVLSVSAFHGFFGADHTDVGASIIAITDNDLGEAESIAQQMADQFIESRHSPRPDRSRSRHGARAGQQGARAGHSCRSCGQRWRGSGERLHAIARRALASRNAGCGTRVPVGSGGRKPMSSRRCR